MNILIGGTGHVGSAVAQCLLNQHQPVLIVARDSQKESAWKKKGANWAIADVNDVARLHEVLQQSDSRLFILNPPGDVKGDAEAAEFQTIHAILQALEHSPLQKIVVESTQGAQPGQGIDDLGTLYELEVGLRSTNFPVTVTRAAYYFSNWDSQWESAKRYGAIKSFFPEDFELAMVAPKDLGKFNAERLLESTSGFEIRNFSGPEDYRPKDVAEAFSEAMGKRIFLDVIPARNWLKAYQSLGYSEASAYSYTNMTQIVLNRDYEIPQNPERGSTRLQDYIYELVSHSSRLM